MNERESLTQPDGVSLVYKYSSDVHCVQQAAECKQMHGFYPGAPCLHSAAYCTHCTEELDQ